MKIVNKWKNVQNKKFLKIVKRPRIIIIQEVNFKKHFNIKIAKCKNEMVKLSNEKSSAMNPSPIEKPGSPNNGVLH